MEENNTPSSRSCPVCGGRNIRFFFEARQVPVYCNLLLPERTLALNAPRGDIWLGYCSTCDHIYNYSFEATKVEYNQAYENSLHFSPRFQNYAASVVERLIDRYDVRGKTVVEIGAGKGDFLIMLCEQGNNQGLGFDPSYEPALADHHSSKVSFIQDYYSEKYSKHKADLVCCRHVLEHIEGPISFLTTIRQAMVENYDVTVFFEVPNAAYTLLDLGIWDIIYEHCSYFSTNSLSRLFRATGFRVLDLSEAFSGQFLTIEAKLAEEVDVTWSNLENFGQHVATFTEKYRKKVRFWRNEVAKLTRTDERTIIWGAGSKGVTFLNIVDPEKAIKYVVDLNPRKHGMYVAGTGQQIVSPEFLGEYQPQIVVITNPNYEQEVRQHLNSMNLVAELRIA